MAAGELIQEIETADHVGAFFLTYFSAALFAVWLPVVICRAAAARAWAARSGQRYELLPQGEQDGAEAGERAGEGEGEREGDAAGGSGTGAVARLLGAVRCAQMLRLGMLFGPLWFFANWTYNASLTLTSVCTALTVLPLC